MRKKSSKNGISRRGGYRENAGRKSTWLHQETCTIRIPKILAKKLLELAHVLDIREDIDNVTLSMSLKPDFMTQSITQKNGSTNRSDMSNTVRIFDFDTKSSFLVNPENNGAEEPAVNHGLDNKPKSNLTSLEQVIDPNFSQTSPSLTEAIAQAKQVLKLKKSARYSLARYLTKLYSTPVSFEQLK